MITGIHCQQKHKFPHNVKLSKLYSHAGNTVAAVIVQSQSAHVLHISQLTQPPPHSPNVHTHHALSFTLTLPSELSTYIVCLLSPTGATGSVCALKINFHIYRY